MTTFQVSGATELANLSRALKNAGRGDLRREWLRRIRQATAPAKVTIPESARATLPRRGGLNETVAAALKIATRSSLSGSQAAVRIIAVDPPRHDIQSMNLGRLRHPTFGHEPWTSQTIPPLFFTTPCMALAPGARRQIAAATDRVLRSIVT